MQSRFNKELCKVWKFMLLLVCVSACGHSSWAADRFQLMNTHPRLAEFEFFAVNSEQWLPTHKIPTQHSKEVILQNVEPHYLQFYSNGARQPVGVFDFHSLIENQQGGTLALNTIYHAEEKTRTIPVAKTRTETRTRTYTVTRMVPEQRTREVTKYEPRTGKPYLVTENYTVMVPVYENKTQEYTVSVPYTEEVEQTYTVMVPRHELVVKNNGEDQPVQQLVGSDENFEGDYDKRERVLGVTLRKGRNGVVVTKVAQGSAATRMRLVSRPEAGNFTFQLDSDEITHINGQPVLTVTEAIEAVQNSPPTITLSVHEWRRNCHRTYQTYLELR